MNFGEVPVTYDSPGAMEVPVTNAISFGKESKVTYYRNRGSGNHASG